MQVCKYIQVFNYTSMKVCMHANLKIGFNMHVCKSAFIQESKYAWHECKYDASLQVWKSSTIKYESMQVCANFAELCKGITRYAMIQPYMARLVTLLSFL